MALPASDNFNRADSATLGANWTDVGVDIPSTFFSIVSNQAKRGTGSASYVAYWSADAFNGDHYSQVTLPTIGDNGVAVRCQSSATCYLIIDANGQVHRLVSNAFTAVGAAFGAFSAGDVMKMTITGTTIEVFKNGASLGTRTDAALSGGASGLWSWSDGVSMDNWSGDNMAGAVADTQEWRGCVEDVGVRRRNPISAMYRTIVDWLRPAWWRTTWQMC